MKLPSDAWNQPEGVSDATWLAYLLLCKDKLTTMVRGSSTYGLQITDSVVLEQHSRALTDLKGKKPQDIATDEFDKELKLLEAQIKENESMYTSRATSLETYRSKQAAMKTIRKKQEQDIADKLRKILQEHVEKTGPRL